MGSTKDQQQFYSVLETLTETEDINDSEEDADALRDEVGTIVLDTGCLKTVTG